MRGSFQVLIALFFWFSFPGFAQQGASPGQVPTLAERPAPVAPPAERRITLDVVVTDRSGNPVPGLQQQDFTLLDGKQPQTISSFRAVDGTSNPADGPLQAIVLIDAINTTYQGVALQRDQLEKFLRHAGGELPLPTSLIMLTEKSGHQTAMTQDGNVLADSLNSAESGLPTIARTAPFFGAMERLQLSITALQRIIASEANQPGRKLLIWVGPGWPLLSDPSVSLGAKDQDTVFHAVVGISTTLREARVTLYNVDLQGLDQSVNRAFDYEEFLKGVSSANKVQNANLALQVLAIQSGGRVLNMGNDIADLITRCLVDRKAFYTLSFDSPAAEHPNEYHNLRVKMGRPGLTARTRTGYYAQP
jgi:VWFA-related protein